MNKKPTLGISACLPGQPVRFDGGHKKARYITQKLSEYFELMPVCPEVEAGLGVPRPTIQLRHHLRRLPNPYLETQRYLAPCPEQLALRSYLT